jgi:UDP-N-acetylglucosamine:LPS N-acetylglucosamine transferase
MPAMVLSRQLGHGAMLVLSHAGNSTIEARCRRRVMLVMVVPSHASDGAAEAT